MLLMQNLSWVRSLGVFFFLECSDWPVDELEWTRVGNFSFVDRLKKRLLFIAEFGWLVMSLPGELLYLGSFLQKVCGLVLLFFCRRRRKTHGPSVPVSVAVIRDWCNEAIHHVINKSFPMAFSSGLKVRGKMWGTVMGGGGSWRAHYRHQVGHRSSYSFIYLQEWQRALFGEKFLSNSFSLCCFQTGLDALTHWLPRRRLRHPRLHYTLTSFYRRVFITHVFSWNATVSFLLVIFLRWKSVAIFFYPVFLRNSNFHVSSHDDY